MTEVLSKYGYSTTPPKKDHYDAKELANPPGHRMGYKKRWNRLVSHSDEFQSYCTCKWRSKWFLSRPRAAKEYYEVHIPECLKQGRLI